MEALPRLPYVKQYLPILVLSLKSTSLPHQIDGSSMRRAWPVLGMSVSPGHKWGFDTEQALNMGHVLNESINWLTN